jgi:DNA-binding response OmpR family regulator
MFIISTLLLRIRFKSIRLKVNMSGKKILIVDDTPGNVDVLRKTLESRGYQISVAPSGEMSLKIVARNLPDLILLDIMMPGIDGFETCLKFRGLPELKETPIIFLSGKATQEDVVEGYKCGASDFLTKPFILEEVLYKVDYLIKWHDTFKENIRLTTQLENYKNRLNSIET